MKVTTIIVSWNTRDYLQKCLGSIEKYFTSLNRTIVIDNNSRDGSVEMVRELFPSVELIANSDNIGFARACNQGIALSNSEIILFLNSDCEILNDKLLPGIIQVFMNDESIGIIGPMILYPNGKLQSAGQEFTSLSMLVKQQLFFQASPIFSKKAELFDRTEPFQVDYVSGSCMFVHKKVIEKVGRFNESLIMYAEDMDLCYRAKHAGYLVVVDARISVIHHKSKSTNKNLVKSLGLSTRNNCVFIKMRSGKLHAFIALYVYLFGTAMRVVIAFFRKSASPKDWFQLLLKIPFLWQEILRLKI